MTWFERILRFWFAGAEAGEEVERPRAFIATPTYWREVQA